MADGYEDEPVLPEGRVHKYRKRDMADPTNPSDILDKGATLDRLDERSNELAMRELADFALQKARERQKGSRHRKDD